MFGFRVDAVDRVYHVAQILSGNIEALARVVIDYYLQRLVLVLVLLLPLCLFSKNNERIFQVDEGGIGVG
jgi:hypothetical protein